MKKFSRVETLIDLYRAVRKSKGESFYDDLYIRLVNLERSLQNSHPNEYKTYLEVR